MHAPCKYRDQLPLEIGVVFICMCLIRLGNLRHLGLSEDRKSSHRGIICDGPVMVVSFASLSRRGPSCTFVTMTRPLLTLRCLNLWRVAGGWLVFGPWRVIML